MKRQDDVIEEDYAIHADREPQFSLVPQHDMSNGVVNILYYISYPLLLCLSWSRILLSWLVSHLLHVGQFFVHIGLLPLRILAKFEVLGVQSVVLLSPEN